MLLLKSLGPWDTWNPRGPERRHALIVDKVTLAHTPAIAQARQVGHAGGGWPIRGVELIGVFKD